MPSFGSEVSVPFYGYELPVESANEIFAQSVRLLLDRLSPAGWENAGLYILSCITNDGFPDLCVFDPDVLDLPPRDQLVINQCLAFFKKRTDIELGIDRRGKALGTFDAAERACSLTNACFRAWSQGRFQFRPDVEAVLHSAQYKISSLLGDAPSWDEIRPRFGPGATTQTPKKNACAAVKLLAAPTCSSNLDDPGALLATIPGYRAGESLECVIHNSRVQFVPKSAKTDRGIATEPQLNGMFQLGLGDYMANLLRKVGIDLTDQSANQRAALYGSISGASATLDMSSASDTVASGLIAHLFPLDWVDLFRTLRSAEADTPDVLSLPLEKISSMGNGFTFALESIVFWAISASAVDLFAKRSRIRTLVYGDDIIVDARVAPKLARILADLGFTVNPSKSFWTGSFRESCGKDYSMGLDVRPVFVKDGPVTGATLYKLHNFFVAAGDDVLAGFFEKLFDPTARLYGPCGYGDGHLWQRSFPLKQKESHVSRGWGGYCFSTWAVKPSQLRGFLAKKVFARRKAVAKKWNSRKGDWSSKENISFLEFHPAVVRRLATYTQYLREDVVLTLTPSDALRSRMSHVYADRRLPDCTTRADSDHIVVPTGKEASYSLCQVYTFEPSLA